MDNTELIIRLTRISGVIEGLGWADEPSADGLVSVAETLDGLIKDLVEKSE